MKHVTVAARIEIGAADQYDAIQTVQELLQIVVFSDRRNDYGYSTDLADGVVIARCDVGEARLVTRCVGEIGVQTNNRLKHRKHSLVWRRPDASLRKFSANEVLRYAQPR